jgi:hypothetical protein
MEWRGGDDDDWPPIERLPGLHGRTRISRIGRCTLGRFGGGIIVGFDDVVLAVQGFIPDDLHVHSVLRGLFDFDDRHVLRLTLAEVNLQNDIVSVVYDVVVHTDVVDPLIPVQIEVVDVQRIRIQSLLEFFESWRLLEDRQDGIQVEIIAGQSQGIRLHGLLRLRGHSADRQCNPRQKDTAS